jgi:hypothetical protein
MNRDTQGTTNKIYFYKNINNQPLTVKINYRIKN